MTMDETVFTMPANHHVFAMPAATPTLEGEAADSAAPSDTEDTMRLPFLSAVPDQDADEIVDVQVVVEADHDGPRDQFRILADFQDVIDAAADAGLIDDEAAVVLHRQLIEWSRGGSDAGADSADALLDAARAEADAMIERARLEIAEIRALTLEECDNILDAARDAADNIRDAHQSDPHLSEAV